MRRSSRAAFAVAWVVFLVAAVLAWRKVLSRDDGDVTGLLVATLAGACGLVVLTSWLQDREGGR